MTRPGEHAAAGPSSGAAPAGAGSGAGGERSLKRRVLWALPYVGLILGLLVIGFFPATEAWDAWQRARQAEEVDSAVEAVDDATIEELFAQAKAYNEELVGLTPDIPLDEIWPYERQLSLTGADDAFGYVVIPEIALTMPVYHGTSDAVLSAGAGHLESSSLPVGGDSTHAVITAHSGMSGMRAFDNLDELEEGDVFGVKVLGRLCCYEVTSTEVVLPDETDSLATEMGEDLCTLVTCTPYGVNDHRLLVHGERCAVPDGFDASPSSPWESALASDRMWPFLVALAIVAVLLAALTAWRVHRHRERVRAGAAAGEAAPAGDAGARGRGDGGGAGG